MLSAGTRRHVGASVMNGRIAEYEPSGVEAPQRFITPAFVSSIAAHRLSWSSATSGNPP